MDDQILLSRIHRLFVDEIAETWLNRPRRRYDGKSYRELARDPHTVDIVQRDLTALEQMGKKKAFADVCPQARS